MGSGCINPVVLISALDGSERSALVSEGIVRRRTCRYSLNGRLRGLESCSERFGEDRIFLSHGKLNHDFSVFESMA